MHTFFATKVARILDKLSKIPEGNGSVLDNTIVLWTSCMGDPTAHSLRGIPMVLAGGAGGKFRMGRYVKYTVEDKAGVTPHNQLLVSLAQAFGVNVNTFGDPQFSGTLPNLT